MTVRIGYISDSESVWLINHPALKPYVRDDGLSQDLVLGYPRGCFSIGMFKDDKLHGMLLFDWMNSYTLCVHNFILPSFYGKTVKEGLRLAFDAVWEKMQVNVIVAMVAECYPGVINRAKSLGFEKFGVNARSWLWAGKWHDVVCMRLERSA